RPHDTALRRRHVPPGHPRLQDCDLQLTRYGDEGWRATFHPTGRAHSVIAGTAWDLPAPVRSSLATRADTAAIVGRRRKRARNWQPRDGGRPFPCTDAERGP